MSSAKDLEEAYERKYLAPLPWWWRATYKALEEAVYQKQGAAIPLLRRGGSRGTNSPFASERAYEIKSKVDALLSELAFLVKKG